MITYGPKKSKIMIFQNCLAMLGICLGIMTGHFEAIKKLNFFENFMFFKSCLLTFGLLFGIITEYL